MAKQNIDHKAIMEAFLKRQGFKKEFPDNMEPKFYWFVKKIKHDLIKDLEINVNLRENLISVYCLDQFFQAEKDLALISKQKLHKNSAINQSLILTLIYFFKLAK